MRERERGRQRETETETERDRNRDRNKERERENLTHNLPVVSGPHGDTGKGRTQKHSGMQRTLPVALRIEEARAPHVERTKA